MKKDWSVDDMLVLFFVAAIVTCSISLIMLIARIVYDDLTGDNHISIAAEEQFSAYDTLREEYLDMIRHNGIDDEEFASDVFHDDLLLKNMTIFFKSLKNGDQCIFEWYQDIVWEDDLLNRHKRERLLALKTLTYFRINRLRIPDSGRGYTHECYYVDDPSITFKIELGVPSPSPVLIEKNSLMSDS